MSRVVQAFSLSGRGVVRGRALDAGGVVLLVGALAAGAGAQEGPGGAAGGAMPVAGMVPMVSVSAVGEEQVVPDRAKIMIGVQTQAATAAQASSANARLQRAVLDTLRGLGIAAEQITTMGYNVYPEQDFDPQTRRPRLRGYNVQNTVVVDVRRLDQVGRVLDAALAKGANTVGGLQFYSSQQEAAHRRALARAVANARQNAEAMATAAGGRLGDLLELSSEVGLRPQPVEGRMLMRSAAAEASPPTAISEGTQTVSASVAVRWRFVRSQ